VLLYLDTSGPQGVALANAGSLVAVRRTTEPRDHAATLPGHVDAVLEYAGIQLSDIRGVCVLAGPGSYTGLRIGLAAAKGFCYALDIPLTLQNSLHLLAQGAAKASDRPVYAALLPARAGEVFLAAYTADGTAAIHPRHASDAEASQLLSTLPLDTGFCGSAVVAQRLGFLSELLAGEEVELQTWIAEGHRQWSAGDFASLVLAEPFYLKAPFTTTPRAASEK